MFGYGLSISETNYLTASVLVVYNLFLRSVEHNIQHRKVVVEKVLAIEVYSRSRLSK